ncbi:DUF6049 family protein [Actinophytocola xanthii]|uniref:Glycoprotein n=1 Tax=Actinophytocola xanthii TaxID=1912961 RepID=A0A1Q8CVA9_9PSEU|nr:DUF6049 family protein [Actinophytocola xanthii]OLF18290.1 hypothetical protein BU204_06960 [Actinophytocola xanthii]
MTRWKAALLAATLLALASAGPVPGAAAEPIGDQVAQTRDGQEMLRLEVESLAPRFVTSATPKLTVTGRITNVGDRRVDDIRVKVQRGEPVERDVDLRDLAKLATDSASSPFVDVSRSLAPGESAAVRLEATVRGTEQSLALTEPGVYPVLVNVNGRPDYGGQARLAAVSLPLPVLSVPGGPAATVGPRPRGISIIWPILDTRPRRLATTDGSVVLTDDDLADSLSPGGRLFGLVNSVAKVTANDGTLLSSLCFAVDPDLLQTVSAMAGGYRVRGENGRLVAGRGAAVATDWLTRVAGLTRGRCVLSVPFADTDLVALSRSGAVDLTQLALASSAIVAELLSPVQPAKELYWPAGGSFDQRTLLDLAALGPTTVLADPTHLQKVRGQPPFTVTGYQTPAPVRALPIDSLVSSALELDRPGAGADTSLQRGLAALTFRALFDSGADGTRILVAPPRRWTASEQELTGYLDLAQRLFDSGSAVPQSLVGTLSGIDQGTAAGLAYTPQDAAREIPTAVTADVARINGTKRDLLNAMDDDNTSDVDPNTLLSPMQYGLLRGTSTAWRGAPERAEAAVEQVDDQLGALCDQVVVNNQGRPLALASGDSPIPVNVYNGLPVSIVVRIRLVAPPGLSPAPPQDVRIPPLSSISRYISAEVTRAGRFKVDAKLSTPGGTKLGSTAQLELSSTSYGIITVAITGTAGAVLVLLVAIRLVRRVRTARAARPGPGPEPILDGEARVEP